MANRAGLDRAMVIEAAASLADSVGLHEASLATLAAQLGVRTPTLYHYVAGLPGLQRELALMGTRELAARMGKAVMGITSEEAILALAHTYRAFAKERPGLYAATLRALPQSDTELYAAGSEMIEIMQIVLAPYHLKNDDMLHVVRAFRSIVHGFASLENVGGFGLPLEVDESFDRLLQTFLRGLKETYTTKNAGL